MVVAKLWDLSPSSFDNTIRVWDLAERRLIRTIPSQVGVNTVRFSDDGRDFVSPADSPKPQVDGGRSGIRTHEPLAGLTVFKTVAFVRSATLPPGSVARPACGFAGFRRARYPLIRG